MAHRYSLSVGDRFFLITGHGAGRAPRTQRPVEAVIEDVQDGRPSRSQEESTLPDTLEQAPEAHGVELDPDSVEVAAFQR